MNTANEYVCPQCGTKLSEEQMFCHNCGFNISAQKQNEKENTAKLCLRCGAELAANASFCSVCGASVEVKNKSKIKEPRTKEYKKALFKKSICVLVALIILITAFFPIITIKGKLYDHKVSVSISPVESIIFCFDAKNVYDTKDPSQSYFVRKAERLFEKHDYYDMEDIDDRQELIVKHFDKIYLTYILGEQIGEEYMSFRISYLINAIISALYIFIAIILFIFSFLDLVLFLTNKNKKWLTTTTVGLLSSIVPLATVAFTAAVYCFSPYSNGVLIVLYYDGPKLFSVGFDSWSFNLSFPSISISLSIIIAITASILILAYLSIDRIFFSGKFTLKVSEIIKRTLSIAAAVILICSMFLPIINFNVTTKFDDEKVAKEETVELTPAYFGNFDISEETKDTYNEVPYSMLKEDIAKYFLGLSRYSMEEFSNGESCEKNTPILLTSFAAFGAEQFTWVSSLIPSIFLTIGFFSAILLFINIFSIATEKSVHKAIIIPLKIIVLMLLIAVIALAITSIIICNFGLEKTIYSIFNNSELASYKESLPSKFDASLSINATIIITCLASILLVCVPMGKKKKSRQINNEKKEKIHTEEITQALNQ